MVGHPGREVWSHPIRRDQGLRRSRSRGCKSNGDLDPESSSNRSPRSAVTNKMDTRKVREMDKTKTCSITVVSPTSVLLFCTLCGPVGVYLCGADAAVLHHITLAHTQENQ